MVDVVVFSALSWERRCALAGIRSVEPAGPRKWTGTSGGRSVLVVQTGIGQERARTAAATLPEAGAFVSAGCAGALVPWLRAGDVVVADRILAPGGAAPIPAAGDGVVAWAAVHGFRVHVGPVVSSPSVLTTAEAKETAAADGALVVEMESAALAAEARARGIPFVGVRVVLDGADDAVPALAGLDPETGDIRIGRVLAAIAVRPPLWFLAARLARQTRIAERRLRGFMRAFLATGPTGALLAPAAASAAIG
jgi:nucleoside phosphorylase